MWKRDEAPRPQTPASPTPPPAPRETADAPSARTDSLRALDRDMVNIWKSVIIKGELTGSEDLTIEGQVEGKIELRQNVLTIGPNGKISAQVFAKAVIVQGHVHGNITASERVDIRDAGSVDGDLSAPRVAIADGAHFRGSIDMQRAVGGDVKIAGEPAKAVATPATPVTPAVAVPAAPGVTPAR